jgi:hypothetical protein
MDNPLKKSFPLELKEDGGGDDCGCGSSSSKNDLREAFDQESGATRFLKEQSDPFTEEEGEDEEVPEEFQDQQNGDEEEEEEMEESRGAVEDVLADINGYSRNEDDGMDEVLAGVLNDINEGDYMHDSDDVKQPYEDQGQPDSTMSHDGEDQDAELPDAERKDEIDEVLAGILDENEQEALREEDPCWEGYTQVGMKTQDGEEVPNCVPDDEVDDAEGYQEESAKSVGGVDILDAVLEDQVDELSRLDRLAEEVLGDSKKKSN